MRGLYDAHLLQMKIERVDQNNRREKQLQFLMKCFIFNISYMDMQLRAIRVVL